MNKNDITLSSNKRKSQQYKINLILEILPLIVNELLT